MLTLILLFTLCCYTIQQSNEYQIGFMINQESLRNTIDKKIRDINGNPRAIGVSKDVKLNESIYMLSNDAITATSDICDYLISNQVYLVITTNPTNSTKSPSIVSYACAFYHIPVIAVQARESEYSDKHIHPTTLRMVPPYSDQARVLSILIKHFKLNKINIIATNDYDGRMTYIKFTTWAYKFGIAIENSILIPPGVSDVKSYLNQLNSTQSKVMVLISSTPDAVSIYHAALEMKLIAKGYIWIANQQSIEGEALLAAPQGIIGIRLQKQNASTLVEDAIELSARSIGKLKDDNLLKSLPPASCNVAAYEWETGNSLYSALINSSGDTKFDWNGDVLNATYEIVNIQLDASSQKYISPLGTLNDETNINVQDQMIVWPGNLSEKPSGSFVSTFLKIVTVRSKPFVYAIENTTECSKIIDLNSKQKKITYIPCREGNRTLCCKGYCMELLDKLAKSLNFTYDLHLVADGQFGSLKKVAGSNVKKWNGMVGEIIEGKADLIVASLTINNERAQYIEFSKPFKYQGITILVKNKSEEPSLASFLRPFKTELWILVLISVHVVAVILYLLDRFSPFGRYRLAQSNKEEDALNLSSAMWFSWGVLLNSGIGEGTPRSFSARVLGMVWAGFAMIIVASYTANLAAFLVLDRPKPVATGIDDPKLRNPDMDSFKYATVTNSSVDAYFRRQVELSTMYTFMTKLNVNNDSDGIQKVKNGELKAFIWDSPVLFHETSNDCDLVTVGDLFGRSGYGIGMPKGSPWSDDISLSVLHFHESGSMEELESTWINFGNCKKATTSATTLGLKHMLGVFIMVAGGIGAGIVIVILEVLYYKHKGWRKQQKKVLKKTTEQWQEHVQDKKNERQNSSRMVHVANGVTSRSVKFNNEKNGNTERPSSVKFNDRNGHIGLNNPTFDNNNEISA